MIPFILTKMAKKKETIRQMFNDISLKYDFLNHFLSLGIDRSWRKRLVKLLGKTNPRSILDVATGTADLAIAMAKIKPEKIVGIDISEKMLAIGQAKVMGQGLERLITLKQGDAEKIPFSDGSFDAITVAFGVRNFENLTLGLTEMKRALRPGGTMMILEFSYPSAFPFKQLYGLYSTLFIPLIGRLVSRNNQAYRYLPVSVKSFPAGNDFLGILENIGMRNSHQVILTLGVASIYIAEKYPVRPKNV